MLFFNLDCFLIHLYLKQLMDFLNQAPFIHSQGPISVYLVAPQDSASLKPTEAVLMDPTANLDMPLLFKAGFPMPEGTTNISKIDILNTFGNNDIDKVHFLLSKYISLF